MSKLTVYEQVSIDGFFTDDDGDMSWAHRSDPEWDAYVAENATRGGALLFGRITYEMMESFWPTPAAKAAMPAVATGMNRMPKYVLSRTMKKTSWENTKVVSGDLVAAVRELKKGKEDLTLLGSGTVASQVVAAGLADTITLVVNPIILGSGRTLFDDVDHLALKLTTSRTFENGNVVSSYVPAG